MKPPGINRPDEDGERRFEEPWQARIFAAVICLVDAGCFRWEEFQQALIAEIGQNEGDSARYYEHWLAAAERLLGDKGLLTPDRLADRIAALLPPPPVRRPVP